jgi:hypothetical protein
MDAFTLGMMYPCIEELEKEKKTRLNNKVWQQGSDLRMKH